MSAATAAPLMDISGTAPVPFTTLVKVELRKSYDTRAGMWLIGSVGVLVVAVLALFTILSIVQESVASYSDFVSFASYASGYFLLPILGIMLVTSEWTQRTAMVTFSLEPRRAHVLAAKWVVGVILTLATVVFSMLVSLVCTGLCELAHPELTTWELGADALAGYVVTQLLSISGGFALATLLLNTPAAIVLFFVYKFIIPSLFALGNALIGWFDEVSVWLDFQTAQAEIYEWNLSGGEEWSHFIVSGLVWLALPIALGVWRILRAEVK